jgi:ATP-binding cassette subfamily F protein 3
MFWLCSEASGCRHKLAMIVLDVQGLRKHFGPEAVLDGVTFEVRPGERIGLLGPNGTGKTTLLRIVAGKEEPDAGRCAIHPSVRVGYLEQQWACTPGRTLWDEARSALDTLFALQRESVEVARALSDATDPGQRRRLSGRYDRLQQELERRDAYQVDHKIERVVEGLGFGRRAFRQPVESLSGGEQSRLMLAKLLLDEPELMLLDEPSNHLDVEATEWLEEFLAQSRAAMILVSHDRYLLDKVTNRTLELFRGTVEAYRGNFSAYRRQKQERLAVGRRAYQRRRLEIEKAREFIRRNAYGQKHAQAEDRRKKLARMTPVDPPREITAAPMGFPPAARSGDVVFRAQRLAKGYDRPLFGDLSFEVARGERWAVLGPNGSGKTTLIGCLLGRIEPDAGRVIVGHGVRIGYFDQQLSTLDENAPVVDAIRPDRQPSDAQQRRDLLARFGLTGEAALERVGKLSGGERSRAALGQLAAAEANVLVLDEPTNHLDLWARDALEQALRRFDGTVLFVSHDRHFVDRVADHLLVIEPGGVRVVRGNYATYQHLVRKGSGGPQRGSGDVLTERGATGKAPLGRRARGPRKARLETPKTSKSRRPAAEAGDSSKPARKKRQFPYRKVDDLEREILCAEARIEELHAALAEPETHRDGNHVRQLKAEIAQQQESLQTLYSHWEEAAELNW